MPSPVCSVKFSHYTPLRWQSIFRHKVKKIATEAGTKYHLFQSDNQKYLRAQCDQCRLDEATKKHFQSIRISEIKVLSEIGIDKITSNISICFSGRKHLQFKYIIIIH